MRPEKGHSNKNFEEPFGPVNVWKIIWAGVPDMSRALSSLLLQKEWDRSLVEKGISDHLFICICNSYRYDAQIPSIWTERRCLTRSYRTRGRIRCCYVINAHRRVVGNILWTVFIWFRRSGGTLWLCGGTTWFKGVKQGVVEGPGAVLNGTRVFAYCSSGFEAENWGTYNKTYSASQMQSALVAMPP